VLTAAHCLSDVSDLLQPGGRFEPAPDTRLTVVSGTDLNAPVREVDVTLAQVHPKFDPHSLAYDAALLRLSDDIDGAVELGRDDLTPGECGIVAGWGETHACPAIVPHLAWACMHVALDDTCARQTSGRVAGRPQLMFAAGGEGASCPQFPSAAVRKGDSGGGFVVTRAGRRRLCGIVSWSGSSPTAPHVLTRTSPVAKWIARETDRK
jgi:secreted trypsin-like serine protease